MSSLACPCRPLMCACRQVTWRAIEALLVATGAGDYETMARALVTIGAASGEVDIKVGWGA